MCAPPILGLVPPPYVTLASTSLGPEVDRKCAQCGGFTRLPERATFKCSYCGTMGKEQLYH